jgi:urease accessory protein
LAVQRPFFPEGADVCHVYVLHPPGGIVGGDRLHVSVDVEAGAHALLTTPAATKAYRAAGRPASLSNDLRVAAGGVLEWLPQETILYDGSDIALSTRVDLQPGAAFLGLDLLCFGLPARHEVGDGGYANGRCKQAFEIWRAGAPLAIERGRFDGDAPVHGSAWGLAGAPVMGTLLAVGAEATDAEPLLAALRERTEALPAGDLGAATVLNGGVIACRYVGPSVERAGTFLRGAWALTRRALIGRDATPPRIWAT